MADVIEVVSDGEGIVVAGKESDIKRYVADLGLLAKASEFHLSDLSMRLKTGADLAERLSGIAAQSAMYLKLTPESALQLQKNGGLLKTKTAGISYAMLGKPGETTMKWLQVQDGPASLLTHPAVLSGIGGLMSQAAHRVEAEAIKALLMQIDEKLDDLRRAQKDSVLATMRMAAAAIEESMMLRNHAGDPKTLWDTVNSVKNEITRVQEEALAALQSQADKMASRKKPAEVKKHARVIEQEVSLQLAILARCFELQDQFSIVELDHVLATAPEKLTGHRIGLAHARNKRRGEVLARTRQLMEKIDQAGAIVNANAIIHARAAQEVIASLNATAEVVAHFHLPLGIDTNRTVLTATSWREAIGDRKQIQAAGKEIAVKGGPALTVALGAGHFVLRGKRK